MIGKIPARVARLAGVALAAAAIFAVTASAASAAEIIYNDLEAPAGNVVSQAFEATQTSSFGDQVEFGETARKNPTITVVMSSWACESGTWNNDNCVTKAGAKFEWPIKWDLYNVSGTNSIGSRIGGGLERFAMPYRPSASPKCTGAEAGEWIHAGQCFNGKAFKLNMPIKGVTVPSKAIIVISFNTSDYGATPQRPKPCDSEPQGCPYDSLNVGVQDGFSNPAGTPPSPGAWPEPDVTYVNGAPESGWTGFQPLFEVKAS